MALYLIPSGPMPTTASIATLSLTAATIKTILQAKLFNTGRIVEWGVSFDGSAAATPVKCELLDTGTVFGTVTASVDADIAKLGSVEDAVASVAGLTLGTAATGYNASAEGTITAVRMFDFQLVPPSSGYVKQFPMGYQPKCIIGNAVRIRCNAPAGVNVYGYIVMDI